MDKFKAFIWKNKGYVIHAVAVVIVFVDPSVKGWVASHQAEAGSVVALWGFLLHWATGK